MDVRIWVLFILLWGILVYRISIQLNTSAEIESNESNETFKAITKVLIRIHNTSQQNIEIFNFIEDNLNNLCKNHKNPLHKRFIENFDYQLKHLANISNEGDVMFHHLFNTHAQLSSDCVQLRRRVRQNTQNICKYFISELKKLFKNLKFVNQSSKMNNVIELGSEYKRSIISNVDQMRLVDGYELFRQKEMEYLSSLVQKRFDFIQNPKDCKYAKKIICDLDHPCGFGCQLHDILSCFTVAYATERTLILTSKSWIYQAVWEEIFQPVSKTCIEYDTDHVRNWPPLGNILRISFLYGLKDLPSYLSLDIPEDLEPRLTKLYGDPSAWWKGQFLKYLLKPKYVTQKMLEKNRIKSGWRKPIVGVHIRRTDKVGYEARFYSVEEYMAYVEDYFLTLEMNNTKIERRIFLISDDPHVITQARKKYPQYSIIGDTDIAETANITTRSTYSSLNGVISDIIMLSLSDYLVCAMGSNICRLAYEIMQSYNTDASDRFDSLDYFYFFIYQNKRSFEALVSHNPRNKNEIHMRRGDLVDAPGHMLNGFYKGHNMRTGKIGSYPTFKVKDVIPRYIFPEYPNVYV